MAAAGAIAPGGSAASSGLRVVHSDAPKDVMDELVASAGRALRAHGKGELRHLHDVAQAIRTDIAARVPGGWHVIVGSSFGSFVSHEAGRMAYFFLGQTGSEAGSARFEWTPLFR